MSYLLAVLSHGYPESPTAEETLDSFLAHVSEKPAYSLLWHDGPGYVYVAEGLGDAPMEARPGDQQQGFCAATRSLWWLAWRRATDAGIPHVFWLEHDFLFLRDFDVSEMAHVLDDARVAQVQLMRQPLNTKEKRHGVVPLAHRTYNGFASVEAFQHSRYFTTNPSLMRASFMRENPWPQAADQCEGRFGIQLVEQGKVFAVMGNGEPWVEHIGALRTGHGY